MACLYNSFYALPRLSISSCRYIQLGVGCMSRYGNVSMFHIVYILQLSKFQAVLGFFLLVSIGLLCSLNLMCVL